MNPTDLIKQFGKSAPGPVFDSIEEQNPDKAVDEAFGTVLVDVYLEKLTDDELVERIARHRRILRSTGKMVVLAHTSDYDYAQVVQIAARTGMRVERTIRMCYLEGEKESLKECQALILSRY